MERDEYETMFHVEARHGWYLGMGEITRKLINRWVPHPGNLRILDAGCGTGLAMTTYLAEYGAVTGFDISEDALHFCRSRKAQRLSRASAVELPFASESFDLVTSFDVLYERAVSSDLAALKEFLRVLIPHGRLLLRVPAYDWLRGQHDVIVHTARRYTAGQLKRLFRESGFTLEHLSYANTFLFPIAATKRLAEKVFPPRKTRSDLTLELGPFNKLLQTVLMWEAPLVARAGMPFGLSIFAIGRKE